MTSQWRWRCLRKLVQSNIRDAPTWPSVAQCGGNIKCIRSWPLQKFFFFFFFFFFLIFGFTFWFDFLTIHKHQVSDDDHVWTGVTHHVWACGGGVASAVLPFVQQAERAVVCQLVSYLDCSPPGSGRVSEPGLDHTEPVGVGVGLGPPSSLTDGPGLGGCTHAIHTLTLSLFIAASRSNREQSPRRRLKPRVVLEEKLISQILWRTCSEWRSPPQGLSLTVPSHFSSKPACQISWSVPVFVLKWSLEVLIQRQILLLCVFEKCCEYAHFNDDHTFFLWYIFIRLAAE